MKRKHMIIKERISLLMEKQKKFQPLETDLGNQLFFMGLRVSASVKTHDEFLFWFIDRGTFRAAVEELVQREYDDNRKFIDSINFLWMTTDQKDNKKKKSNCAKQFKKGDAIVNEREIWNCFHKEGWKRNEKDVCQ